MYRGRPWTIRQYAGFASAEESNARYRYLLERGQTGLSIAFDLPTQLGYDSDDPRALGEVGRTGVAIDSLADMEILLAGIPLGEVSTSMTINAPASLLLLLYELVAEEQGVPRDRAARHRAERHPQGVHRARELHLPAAAVDAADDRSVRLLRRADPVAGTRSRSPATTSARPARPRCRSSRSRSRTGSPTARPRSTAGLSPDDFGARLSFFFNAHNDFFQEVAKFRAARRLWARVMRERFGATNPKALALRFHAQTGGSTLTAQQPENNIVRVAIQALSAVARRRAVAPHELVRRGARAADASMRRRSRCARSRSSQHEAGTTDTADPLGGSYYIEALTDELEARAWELIERDRRARRRRRGGRAGLRAGRDRERRVPVAAGRSSRASG